MFVWVFLLISVAFGETHACGGEIRNKTGFVTSPGFPSNYPSSNRICTWNIIAKPKEIIQLQFTNFTLTSCSNCVCDYVEIYSILSGGRSKLEGKFCGSSIPSVIQSEENHLRITFRTEGYYSNKGFKAIYKVYSPSITRNVEWLRNQIKRRKAIELPRAALALFLAEPELFAPENNTATELRDKITISILALMARNITLSSQELALYIQALMVTCQDPRDFYGHDLVSELREKVDHPSAYTNPFEVLALCNAGADVTERDVAKVSTAFYSQLRSFWTDVQAIATMAMQCLSSRVAVDEREIEDMQNELKKRQFKNGTVESLTTTALVVQALRYNNSLQAFFNLTSALDVLTSAQDEDGSWGGSARNSFYILPALAEKSFLDISSHNCSKTKESEEEALGGLQEIRGEKFVVQYSVWIGNDVDLGRTWRVRVPSKKRTSFYDVLETVSKLDNRHNVTYQVVDGKPYVRALLGKEDDPVLGVFWFTYIRYTSPQALLQHVETSPADIRVLPNQELILWYKLNDWRNNTLIH